MRLNPDYFNSPEPDPDPEEVTISKFSDLPDSMRVQLDKMRARVDHMLEDEHDKDPNNDPQVLYLALLAIQLGAVNEELDAARANISMLADGLDKAYAEIRKLGGEL